MTQRHRKVKVANDLVFDIYYQPGPVVYHEASPHETVEYKILMNGQLVLFSPKGRNAWVCPQKMHMFRASPEHHDIAFVLMMDSLTNELFIDMCLDLEQRAGRQKKAYYQSMSQYREVSHLLWNQINDEFPKVIQGLEAALGVPEQAA